MASVDSCKPGNSAVARTRTHPVGPHPQAKRCTVQLSYTRLLSFLPLEAALFHANFESKHGRRRTVPYSCQISCSMMSPFRRTPQVFLLGHESRSFITPGKDISATVELEGGEPSQANGLFQFGTSTHGTIDPSSAKLDFLSCFS